MKITNIETKIIASQRKKPFRIAFNVSTYSESVYVKITTDEGIYGLGEGSPFAPVTGETIPGMLAAIDHMKQGLLGMDPFNIEGIHAHMDRVLFGNAAAKAAIDIACYDIMGKACKQPVYELLGGMSNSLVTDITIGIKSPDEMAQEAEERVAEGFHIIKVKCGISSEEDILALKKIREAVGEDIHLRIDVNQGYTLSQAVETFEKMREFNIEEAEQPLPYWDMDGMALLRSKTKMRIMMDEGVHTPQQAAAACKKEACDFINIKLMKCGGIYKALQISNICESFGVPCILGCMSESKLALTAAAAVVAARKNIIDSDLDSFLLFHDNAASIKGGMEISGDVITLPDKPGLGFDDFEF